MLAAMKSRSFGRRDALRMTAPELEAEELDAPPPTGTPVATRLSPLHYALAGAPEFASQRVKVCGFTFGNMSR